MSSNLTGDAAARAVPPRRLTRKQAYRFREPQKEKEAASAQSARWSRLHLADTEGCSYVWRFCRERYTSGHYWTLQTHEGTLRVLERTWLASLPRIQLISENYGLTLKEALS